MPARFPFVATPEAAEPQPQPIAERTCTLLGAKPGGRDIWRLGSKYILKDGEYYPGREVEVTNTNFAASIINGPVGEIATSWREGDRFLSIHKRLEGESLRYALLKSTPLDLARIGKQVGELIIRLKKITAPQIEMLDGRPVTDRRLLKPMHASSSECFAVCTSNEEVAANLALRIEHLIDHETLCAFMAKMPSAEPFTFTHSDIYEDNIIVKDGNFVGLVDWELSGFYPHWWEFVNSCSLLSDHLPATVQDRDALDWFHIYHAIRELPSDESAKMVSDYLRYSEM
ncbi:kinase-like protein [Hypoxylon sp. FL1857]|nr:kinase-like protein [Hypoxylon sp. FL1857]